MSRDGYVVGGSDKGDIYIWKLDLVAIKQRKGTSPYAKLIHSSKKHQKSVHFCEFSPDGKLLFTGSVDGTAKIWRIEGSCSPYLNMLSDEKLVVTLEEKRVATKEEQK